MTYAAPILVIFALSMACFTDPQGVFSIWIAKPAVVSVIHSVDCAKGAHTKITTASGSICVRETPEEVVKRLDETN